MPRRKSAELDALRKRARQAEKSASAKIKKIARGTYNPVNNPALSYLNKGDYGVDITGTEYDPRKKRGTVDRMSKKQLNAYIDRLNEFTRSSNISYYAGAKDRKTGEPAIISLSAMSKLVHATKARNERLAKYREEQAEMPLPWRGSGMTAGEYDKRWRVHSRYFDSSSAYSLEPAPIPIPTRYTSDAAARTVAAGRVREITPKAHSERIQNMRDQINGMLKTIGDPTLKRLLDLSDEVLWFLWTADESLADYLAFLYLMMMNADKDDIIDILESRAGNSYEEISMMLIYGEHYEEIKRNPKYAKKIKRKTPTKSALAGGRFGDYYQRR